MTIAAKVTASTLGVGVVSLMGCYVGGVFGGERKWHSLTPDSYNSNTVGKEYGRYLTGTGEENRQGGEESYRTKYTPDKNNTSSLHEIFASGKVTDGYSDIKSATSLNKVCEEAYKKNITSDIIFDTTGTENKNKLGANILKYCSPLGRTPNIMDNSNNAQTIGNTGQTQKLVSITDKNNDGFGKAQQEGFKGLKDEANSSLGSFFEKRKEQDIKTICEEAYGKAAATGSSTESEPSTTDVIKYCSFKQLTSP